MSAAHHQLPSGWAPCTVHDISDLLRGISYSKTQASAAPAPSLVPILRANNINGHLNYDGLVYVPRDLVKPEQYLKQGDIVLCMSSGSQNLVGKSAPATKDYDASCGAFCALLRVQRHTSAAFLGLLLQGRQFRTSISQVAKGSNINNLKREHILRYALNLPPLPEQHRIVAKIEELFSELDKGIENLRQARTQLAAYRQSLLKHAFEGKLTADWRKANADKLESADQLLARIRVSRRAIWEDAQAQRFKEAGREPPKDWKSRYKEPSGPNTAALKKLPQGWNWATPEQLGDVQLGRQRAPQHHSLDTTWLKDKSLADLDNLPDPKDLAEDIVENLEAGLNNFRTVLAALQK